MSGFGPSHLEKGSDFRAFHHCAMPAQWVSLWRAAPDKVIIQGPKPVTAGALLERSERFARGLLASGLEPGDRVILSAGTSAEVVVAYVAILRAGLVVVPMNTAYRRREVMHIVGDAAPRAAVVDSDETAAWLAEDAPSVAVISPSSPPTGAVDAPLDSISPESLAMICYTSGTTGAPKGAMLLHRNLFASAKAVILAWRWTPRDCLILSLPLFHLHGLGVGLNGTLLAGAGMILLDRFSPEAVVAAAKDATMFFGVPSMYQRLLELPDISGMGNLRLCVSGSAPLPAAMHEAFSSRTGQIILERYGMTETLMNVSHLYDGERRPGTVGYPLPGVEIRLENGRSGEISLRGPNIFAGYWRNEAATKEVLDAEGWFRTGDIGEIDEDGQLRLVARAKELIISGGYNVYPREVEDVLRNAPGVVDAAVIGMPSEKWGEAVVAFIEGEIDQQALRDIVEANLAPYKRPKAFVPIEALPRNALGKVTKNVLKDKAASMGLAV